MPRTARSLPRARRTIPPISATSEWRLHGGLWRMSRTGLTVKSLRCETATSARSRNTRGAIRNLDRSPTSTKPNGTIGQAGRPVDACPTRDQTALPAQAMNALHEFRDAALRRAASYPIPDLPASSCLTLFLGQRLRDLPAQCGGRAPFFLETPQPVPQTDDFPFFFRVHHVHP